MPELAFTDQRTRLTRILHNALEACLYDSSEIHEDGRILVLKAHRAGGQAVTVRFRGLSSSEASAQPSAGAPIQIRSVDLASSGFLSIFSFAFPRLRSPGPGYAHVRIGAGDARLDIVCQDAEWWEEDTPTA
jgi:hypothetical protein